jgi:hypothetical protein
MVPAFEEARAFLPRITTAAEPHVAAEKEITFVTEGSAVHRMRSAAFRFCLPGRASAQLLLHISRDATANEVARDVVEAAKAAFEQNGYGEEDLRDLQLLNAQWQWH